MKFQAPKGTFDVLPEQEHVRERIEQAAHRLFARSGYRRIETPAFEETELFARGVGESTDIVRKEMFTFTDQGGRSLTLRPEGTAPICRAYVQQGMHKLPQPVKLWYQGPFFRQERPQAGRFRQFNQIGAEAIGSDSPLVDAELIILLNDLLAELEVPALRLRLSSLGSAESRKAYREKLIAYLREHQSDLAPEVSERIDLNPLRAFDSDHPATAEVMRAAPKMLDELSPDDSEHFDQVRRLLDEGGVEYELDPTLVRGLDYYSRTVFELTCDRLGAQSGVGGGGRYDALVEQMGGPATPAAGWAAGIERIALAMDAADSPRSIDAFVALVPGGSTERALAIATEIRRAGMGAELELAGRALKGQMKHAARLGARFAVIVEADGLQLRDMDSGSQEPVDSGDLLERLRRGLRARAATTEDEEALT